MDHRRPQRLSYGPLVLLICACHSVLEIHGANADGIRSNRADEKGRRPETLAHQAVASTVMILSKSLFLKRYRQR